MHPSRPPTGLINASRLLEVRSHHSASTPGCTGIAALSIFPSLKCRAARSGSIRKLAHEAENDFSRIAANVRKGWEAVKNVMSGHKPSSQMEEGYAERPSGSEREDEVDALFDKGEPTNADACLVPSMWLI